MHVLAIDSAILETVPSSVSANASHPVTARVKILPHSQVQAFGTGTTGKVVRCRKVQFPCRSLGAFRACRLLCGRVRVSVFELLVEK